MTRAFYVVRGPGERAFRAAPGAACCAGNPADVVIEQARLLTAEVIVMGHHHLSRLRRWANPSTSGEVIDRSNCPVLIETRDKG
ncbi:universal stress protein [Paraburkholderia xenovorans]